MNDFRYDKSRKTLIPAHPGYYWAKWLSPAEGTHEADEVSWPALRWEIVQVNDNNVDDPADDEYLSVSVPGVRETQWRENFKWGPFVAPVVAAGLLYPATKTAVAPDLIAALKDIEFIVDGKEDADDGIPNDAMKIMSVVQTALRPLSSTHETNP